MSNYFLTVTKNGSLYSSKEEYLPQYYSSTDPIWSEAKYYKIDLPSFTIKRVHPKLVLDSSPQLIKGKK